MGLHDHTHTSTTEIRYCVSLVQLDRPNAYAEPDRWRVTVIHVPVYAATGPDGKDYLVAGSLCFPGTHEGDKAIVEAIVADHRRRLTSSVIGHHYFSSPDTFHGQRKTAAHWNSRQEREAFAQAMGASGGVALLAARAGNSVVRRKDGDLDANPAGMPSPDWSDADPTDWQFTGLSPYGLI